MILIGRYFSPFVRRVGATLQHYGIDYEHRSIRASGEGQDEIRQSNPLGRVPVLICDDGEVLADSAVILEYLDDRAGPEKALMPLSGSERFKLQSLLAISTGAVEKALAVFGEKNRPEERRHAPVVEGSTRQAKDGFEYLDARASSPWITGEKLTQVDVTTAAYLDFIEAAIPEVYAAMKIPKLDAVLARAKALPEFRATSFE